MTLHFVNSELMLEQPQHHQIRVQKDNGRVKSFANTTWEDIYSIIKTGYDAGKYTSFYEQRDEYKPCNFYVDIDGHIVEDGEFNEIAYLEQIRKDFDNAGITEPWKVQSSCGLEGSGFKISSTPFDNSVKIIWVVQDKDVPHDFVFVSSNSVVEFRRTIWHLYPVVLKPSCPFGATVAVIVFDAVWTLTTGSAGRPTTSVIEVGDVELTSPFVSVMVQVNAVS